MKGFIVELQQGVWLAPWQGDPGRTLVKHSARVYQTEHGARVALGIARKCRPFAKARIVPSDRAGLLHYGIDETGAAVLTIETGRGDRETLRIPTADLKKIANLRSALFFPRLEPLHDDTAKIADQLAKVEQQIKRVVMTSKTLDNAV